MIANMLNRIAIRLMRIASFLDGGRLSVKRFAPDGSALGEDVYDNRVKETP